MADEQFLQPGTEVEVRRLDDSGIGLIAKVASTGEVPGEFKLRWKEPGAAPADAPKVGALVRIIRRTAGGDAAAVRAQVAAVGGSGLIVHTSGAVTAYEKRGYDRADVSFPMAYRKLTGAEAVALRSEIVGSSAAAVAGSAAASMAASAHGGPPGTPAQQRIEQKLDLILQHLGLAEGRLPTHAPGATAIGRKGATGLDLSGSGLRFRVGERLVAGDQLEVRFDLPGGRDQRVRALVEIVREIASKAGSHDVGGRFRTMSDPARAGVIRFVKDVVREQRSGSLRKSA